MSVGNRIKAIPIVTFNTATLAGAYLPVNPAGLPQACSTITIKNESNVDLAISYDGITQHDILKTGDWLGDMQAQMLSQPPNNVCLWPKGLKIYVKSAVGVGNVYLTGFYQD